MWLDLLSLHSQKLIIERMERFLVRGAAKQSPCSMITALPRHHMPFELSIFEYSKTEFFP